MIRLLLVALMLLPVGAVDAASQDASPVAEVACVVAPRSADDLIDLWFDGEGTPRVATGARENPSLGALDLDQGEPVAGAIATVTREWAACRNAGDILRADALLTDAYAGESAPGFETPEQARAWLAGPPTPVATEARMTIGPAHDARRFPDGRVGATFAITGFAMPDEALTVFVTFAEVDGQWRIDGMQAFLMPPPVAPVSGFRVLETYPHDPNAFTQGLVYIDGKLYEGTGLNGESSLRLVDLDTGVAVQSHPLAEEYFGEGIVVLGDRIYQITWKSGVAFVYDRATFEQLETFTYTGEGWGLTTDGERLIMSDGSDRLFFRDPETFEVLDQVRVQDAGLPVSNLNELEYIDGEVWANVWQTDWIVRIDPATGDVLGWVDMHGLRPADGSRWENADVLNGIAWDPVSGVLLVTGKDWPELYRIELVPPS